MGKKNKKVPDKINPNEIKTRDENLLALINGATKGGAHRNHKKEANKYKSRGKYRGEDD